MNIEEYISSGILELYVYGALSEEESREVSAELKKHPEIKQEVEAIEEALQQLATAAAPYNAEEILISIKNKLNLQDENSSGAIPINRKKGNTKLIMYISWAASIVLLIGIFKLLSDNNQLRKSLSSSRIEIMQMEQQIVDIRTENEESQKLLHIFRDKDIVKIPLGGQKVAPDAYAAVFWDKQKNRVFIDAKDLPAPPEGKEYQVWSLTLDPLTPTSIGLLSNFKDDANKIFMLENANSSQAFGITLEPKGGSKTPTMEQLYTLGTVQS